MSHSVNSLDYAPAVANELSLPLVTDVVEVEYDDDGLTAIRETYGSKLETTVMGFEEIGDGNADITEADVLISIGRGIEKEENLPLIEAFADAMNAMLSSSRPIVDNRWLPTNRQVGQTGMVVTPDVYLAIGISGAVQHVAGMKESDTIVAINTDPSAPILDIANYAIVGDMFDVVPILIEEFGGEAPDI